MKDKFKGFLKFILTFIISSLVLGLPIGIYEKYFLKSPVDDLIYGYVMLWGALFVTIIISIVKRKKSEPKV